MLPGTKMKCKCKSDVYEDLATTKELLRQANHELDKFKWISVHEKQPEEGQFVNLCGGNVDGVSSGFYTPTYGLTAFEVVDDGEMQILSANNWLPLPSAPTNN